VVIAFGGAEPGTYVGTLDIGWVAAYELSVEHPWGSLTGIPVTPPTTFTIGLDPPPKVSTSSTVTWTPHGETDVTALIQTGEYSTPMNSPLDDTGSFKLPTTAYPVGYGGYDTYVTMERSREVVTKEVYLWTRLFAYKGTMPIEP